VVVDLVVELAEVVTPADVVASGEEVIVVV